MNIHQFDYIIAVEELQNFGQAAERCYVTQSTLSTMIARFEDEIGVRIFDRSTKPVTITKEGRGVLRQLRVINKEIENLHEVVDSLTGESKGVITIGAIPTIGPYLLPLFIHDFIQKFPHIRFEISEITTEQIIDQIQRRILDIGIVSVPLNIPEIKELWLYDEVFWGFDAGIKAQRDHINQSDIDIERLWLLEEGHCMRTQVETLCGSHQKRDLKRNLDYKSGTIDTLIKFVEKTKGMTLLPHLATLDLDENKRRFLRAFATPVPARSVGLIYHEHFVKKKVLNALKKHIIDKVSQVHTDDTADTQILCPV